MTIQYKFFVFSVDVVNLSQIRILCKYMKTLLIVDILENLYSLMVGQRARIILVIILAQ